MNERSAPAAMSPANIIFHPVRLRIIRALGGRRMTPPGVARELLEIPTASLYRHLNALVAAGIAEVVGERPVRGATERTYTIAEGRGVLTPADVRGMSADEHLRLFAVFLASVLSDFGRYLDRGQPDLETDGVGYRQLDLYLSDEELREMLEEMNAAVRQRVAQGPAPGRQRRLLTTILMPAVAPENEEDEGTS